MLSLSRIANMLKQGFALIYLASSMGLLANLLIQYPKVGDTSETSQLFIMAWLVLYSCSLLFIFFSPGSLLKRVNGLTISLYILVLYSILSSLWSDDSFNSLSYSGVLALNLLFCFWLVNEFNYQQILNVIYRAIFIMVICSLVFYAVGYSGVLYYDPHGRETLLGTQPLRGFFNHKITAGLYAVFGLLLCMSLKKGLHRIVSCSLLVLFALLTGSSAAIGLLLIAIIIYGCIKSMLYHRFSLGVFITIVFLVPLTAVLLFIFVGEELLAALGRDPTLTGRTLLWGWGVDVALQKPWLGWGYQGYMGTEHAKAYALSIPQFVNYNVPHFHNAYIQLLVELGALGFMFFFVSYMIVVARLYVLSSCQQFYDLISLLTILTLLLVSSFFINTFFQYNDFSTILFFISAILIYRNYSLKLRCQPE